MLHTEVDGRARSLSWTGIVTCKVHLRKSHSDADFGLHVGNSLRRPKLTSARPHFWLEAYKSFIAFSGRARCFSHSTSILPEPWLRRKGGLPLLTMRVASSSQSLFRDTSFLKVRSSSGARHSASSTFHQSSETGSTSTSSPSTRTFGSSERAFSANEALHVSLSSRPAVRFTAKHKHYPTISTISASTAKTSDQQARISRHYLL